MTRPIFCPVVKILSSGGNRANHRRLGANLFDLPRIVTWLPIGQQQQVLQDQTNRDRGLHVRVSRRVY